MSSIDDSSGGGGSMHETVRRLALNLTMCWRSGRVGRGMVQLIITLLRYFLTPVKQDGDLDSGLEFDSLYLYNIVVD